MELDLELLEQGVTLEYNEKLPCFRRHISHPDDSKTRIKYHFGFPRVNRFRFGTIDIYDKNSRSLPKEVRTFFAEKNGDRYCAYIYQFYPNGNPNSRNARLIKSREGNGIGTAGFNLVREDLGKLNVRNVFIAPMSNRMISFLLKRDFELITESRPWQNFSLTVSLYGKVLSS